LKVRCVNISENTNWHSLLEAMIFLQETLLVCLHDHNKSGFFGGPAFMKPIRAIWKVFKKTWLAGKKPVLQKRHFCFDHVNRLYINYQ